LPSATPTFSARLIALCALLLCIASPVTSAAKQAARKAPAQEKPIPVGLDAYREWAQWDRQRIGMRAYMRSTYDRSGGNEGADASHFLYQLSDTSNVTLDLEGAGILMFARYNHWHGSPWHYTVDGNDYTVQETSTADPHHPAPNSTFLPAQAFPAALNLTWAQTNGADLSWTPIPFERSFRMAYTRTHYGTSYYIYDQFVPGTPLSTPIRSWNETAAPDPDKTQAVADLLAKSGTDIAPTANAHSAGGTVSLPANGVAPIVSLKGRQTIRALTFSIPAESAAAFEHAHLRITWDGRAQPSVDAPIALFFGAGTLYNRDNREYLVKAFPVSIRFTGGRIQLACYFPMPFFQSARIELAGAGQAVEGVEWTARSLPLREPKSQLAYFHATYRDFPTPTPGEDLVLLDSRGAEGDQAWSGSFVGTSFIFSHNANLETLEGDPRFFFDDSLTPQAQGTGTEEWGGGGDYWGGLNMSLPFVGHPTGARSAKAAVNETDKIESAYRFLLGDLMPFGSNAVIHLEHGGLNESTEHYETIAYWYGLPSPSLVETDRLQIGDAADEQAHGYSSPQASEPYKISSRYEWGVDSINGKQVFPETEDHGRTTKGTSEFRMRLRPDNLGVLLRRKLDYSFADQRAEVYIAGPSRSTWKLAGIWYLAGSNTCVYSNPKDELGPAEHKVEISNRRFRDDEFLIARNLTHGRKAIWVRIKYTPINRPLFPGSPVGERAWSEIRYTAYSFITPPASAPPPAPLPPSPATPAASGRRLSALPPA
jgi:hypothetical protein